MKPMKFCLIALSLYATVSYADAQVVDATPIDPQQIQRQNPVLSTEQRLARLEQQLQNNQQFDINNQIASLQQAIQELRGQLDVQNHQLKQLEQRLNDFYQDLNKRIEDNKVKTRTTIAAAPIIPNAPAKPKPVAKPKKAQPVSVETTPAADDNATDNFPLAASDSAATTAGVAPAASQPAVDTDTNNPVQEQNAYQTAYNSLKNRNYAQATQAMEKYLQQYPTGKYAANAHYWLGELYMVQGQQDKAASQFNTIITRYPDDGKIADAILKLGIVYYNKGQYVQAKSTFEQVKAKYPGSAAARLANARLQEMAQSGKN